jgi:hypothetical protein
MGGSRPDVFYIDDYLDVFRFRLCRIIVILLCFTRCYTQLLLLLILLLLMSFSVVAGLYVALYLEAESNAVRQWTN